MNTDKTSTREDQKAAPLNVEWDYAGGGWFRQKGAPKGDVAPTVHAPTLYAAFQARVKELEAELRESEARSNSWRARTKQLERQRDRLHTALEEIERRISHARERTGMDKQYQPVLALCRLVLDREVPDE